VLGRVARAARSGCLHRQRLSASGTWSRHQFLLSWVGSADHRQAVTKTTNFAHRTGIERGRSLLGQVLCLRFTGTAATVGKTLSNHDLPFQVTSENEDRLTAPCPYELCALSRRDSGSNDASLAAIPDFEVFRRYDRAKAGTAAIFGSRLSRKHQTVRGQLKDS